MSTDESESDPATSSSDDSSSESESEAESESESEAGGGPGYPYPWDPSNAREILEWTIEQQLDHLIFVSQSTAPSITLTHARICLWAHKDLLQPYCIPYCIPYCTGFRAWQ